MNKNRVLHPVSALTVFFLFFIACNNSKQPPEKVIAQSPKELQQKASDLISEMLSFAKNNDGKIFDSIHLRQLSPDQLIYQKFDNASLWSKEDKWQPIGDSLFNFIDNAKLYGLFPEDYHYKELISIRTRFHNDSLGRSDRKNAVLWARADLMLTDAFAQILKDIKLGRLPQDSITMRKDSVLNDEFYFQQYDILRISNSLSQVISTLEPKHEGYRLLKAGIKNFLDSFDNKNYTYVPAPSKDTASFRKTLQKRLYEGGFFTTDSVRADSAQLATAIKKFQKIKGITVDGKAGNETIRALNRTDREKFLSLAITMDRYKMLPPKLPQKFLWVNLPAFSLELWENDSIKLFSKIICGKPATRSPVLTSAISELITYPKWTIPESIIEKEVLPGLKKDPFYLIKKGYGLFDSKGNELRSDSINWKKYKKTIPFHVIQGSGDANALGIMKFNFNNKYSVYLHDTNERFLFANNDRAKSHGCIRVQEWKQLADYILVNDAMGKEHSAKMDSVQVWLEKKEKHSVSISNRLPLFVRYYTAEGKDGKIVFYDDIYGEDKQLAEKYFPDK